MHGLNRQQTTPVNYPRTNRNHAVSVMTSLAAGKCVPLAFIPMLREDSLQGRIRVAVEMMETKEILANGTNLRVSAHVMPALANERFQGSRDQFDRSYMGLPKDEDVGAAVVPWVETHVMPAHGAYSIYKAVGLHGKPGDIVSTAYMEAYNAVWNWRARNLSPKITKRPRIDTSLAPAFWNHSRFAHVLPDFDQAQIDGEVALNVVNNKLWVKGIGLGTGSPTVNTLTRRESDGNTYSEPGTLTAGDIRFDVKGTAPNMFPDIFAEMAANGITVSLSNIEMAKRTQAFSKLREKYQGHDDEFLIDMLMDGLTVPDQDLKQPFFVAEKVVRFGQAKRYATNSGNLAESAVSGAAMLDLHIKVNRLDTGGVLVITAECVPDQLFERQRDPYFYTTDVNDFPEALRDTLDPEKVDIVLNGEIDTSHANPLGTFGYAPLHWKWNAWGPRIGGKFFRPTVDAGTDTYRQRFWAVETANPSLSQDFYLVPASIHTKVFLDQASDPFEAAVSGNLIANGLTRFGGMLVEATNNYDKVEEKAPKDRIVKA